MHVRECHAAGNNVVGLIPRILFPLIMLLVFIALTGRFWTSIFRKLSGWDVLNMFFLAALNTVVALIRTKNILVSTGAHIINDWGGFTFALVTGLAAGAATS